MLVDHRFHGYGQQKRGLDCLRVDHVFFPDFSRSSRRASPHARKHACWRAITWNPQRVKCFPRRFGFSDRYKKSFPTTRRIPGHGMPMPSTLDRSQTVLCRPSQTPPWPISSCPCPSLDRSLCCAPCNRRACCDGRYPGRRLWSRARRRGGIPCVNRSP